MVARRPSRSQATVNPEVSQDMGWPRFLMNPAMLFQAPYMARGTGGDNAVSGPARLQGHVARTGSPADLTRIEQAEGPQQFWSTVRMATFPLTAPVEGAVALLNNLFAAPEPKMAMGENRSGFRGGL